MPATRASKHAGQLQLISNGRLEFGLGSGAYQREFDRMKPGLDQKGSWQYMQEMLHLVRDLWHGDVAHDGKYWQFPTATSCHKPLQETVPMWVAARAPITFDYAVTNDCNIMNWPLTQPFSEAEKYRSQLEPAVTAHRFFVRAADFQAHQYQIGFFSNHRVNFPFRCSVCRS